MTDPHSISYCLNATSSTIWLYSEGPEAPKKIYKQGLRDAFDLINNNNNSSPTASPTNPTNQPNLT